MMMLPGAAKGVRARAVVTAGAPIQESLVWVLRPGLLDAAC